MIKYIWALAFSVSFLFNAGAQSDLSDYSFVVVPDKYEFQFENDQYQLNSLTKFLFNKYGFHAFFNNELPEVSRCDGLWADLERDSGFIWTKLTFVLKDCEGNEVYRSSEGKSKLKEYGKAYQQALRAAFDGIIVMGVQQKDINTLGISQHDTNTPKTEKVVASTPLETNTQVPISEEIIPVSAIDNEDNMYMNNGVFFILKTEGANHKLFEKQDEALVLKGKMVTSENGNMVFTDISGNQFNALFDVDKNLIIETGFQQLKFQLQR